MLYRDFTTLEQLDAQYDLDRHHPDFDGLFAHITALSQRALDTLEHRLDVRFGPTLDEHVDVYPARPDGPPRPVFVFVHGGYWRLGTARLNALAAPGLVAHGVDVVVTNYALSPTVTIEEITRQSRAAVAWVHEHAHEWGGDPDRIVVGGHSAGAQQAAMVRHTDWVGQYGRPADLVKGSLMISGLYDLRPLPFTAVAPALQLSHRLIATQSPQLLSPPRDPRVVMTWGGQETAEFRRQSTDYLAALQAAGVQARGFALDGQDHFQPWLALTDPDSAVTGAALELIRALE